jgi:hypothetical protein
MSKKKTKQYARRFHASKKREREQRKAERKQQAMPNEQAPEGTP